MLTASAIQDVLRLCTGPLFSVAMAIKNKAWRYARLASHVRAWGPSAFKAASSDVTRAVKASDLRAEVQQATARSRARSRAVRTV